MSKLLFLVLMSLSFLKANGNFFIEAGKNFNIDPKLLWVIAYKESRHNPEAVSKKNKNGTYDIGIMQINSAHLPYLKKNYNISKQDLFNARTNIYVGAMILKKCLNKHGKTINGITCYNGRITNNPYGADVLRIMKEMDEKHKKIVVKRTSLVKTMKE